MIALLQMSLGGMCCQKVSEAEALVRECVGDVLITNEVVGRDVYKRQLLFGNVSPEIPVTYVQEHSDCVVTVDAATAACPPLGI